MMETFSPEHSELERNPTKLTRFVELLEVAFGYHARVVGILEMGSFAKREAVPSSDIDTRVYVTSPRVHLVNLGVTLDKAPPLYNDFCCVHPPLPRQDYTWPAFNEPTIEQISTALSTNLEFAFVDHRYVAYELTRLADHPSFEHSILLQSNVLYDPDGFLADARQQLQGHIFAPLAKRYTSQFLDQLSPRIYAFLTPESFDAFKLSKSGQIQWVQQAVRAVRNAVATKHYCTTGTFLYKKSDVLAFVAHYLPAELAFVQELYRWKSDPTVRAAMVTEFGNDPTPFYTEFHARMPQLEAPSA
ncbi:MAG: hypothetical protein R2932_57775 [Caldilineaceae bacterium]